MSDRLPNIDEALEGMARSLADTIKGRGMEEPLMVGIRTGGAWIAERLHEHLSLKEPLGMLDIAFYRDDFSQVGIDPMVRPSHLPVDLEGRDVILVDDVLHTGRTIRAALNELFDYGRPASVKLAVLIDRGGRELPIQADVVGTELHLADGEHVKLAGPEPLSLELRTEVDG